MNEFRKLRAWLIHTFNSIGPYTRRTFMPNVVRVVQKDGWHMVSGSEKVAFIHGHNPYVFKVNYSSSNDGDVFPNMAYREFCSYRKLKAWLPRRVVPTALINDAILVQPKTETYSGISSALVYDFCADLSEKYKVPIRGKTWHFLQDMLSRHVGYSDGHEGNFGVWRNRLCLIDFNGGFVSASALKPPRC